MVNFSKHYDLKEDLFIFKATFITCISVLVDKDNPGVLILSPFAGAGDTMHEALRVNPYELGNVAQVQILVDRNKMKIKKGQYNIKLFIIQFLI